MAITGLRRAPLEEFPGYYIVENGVIYHERYVTEDWGVVQCVSKRVDRAGYVTCRLRINGEVNTKLIHRLLAENFIPNPLHLPFINHLDGNKRNNKLSNLAWCTHSENVQHAFDNGMNSSAKRVIHKKTGLVFPSIMAASSFVGMNYNTLCKRLERNDPSFPLRYLR